MEETDMTVTKRQREMLRFIETYWNEEHQSPTRMEIAKHFGFSSVGTVQRHLDRLVESGLLIREPHKHRSIRPVRDTIDPVPGKRSMTAVPLLGTIRAGSPVESFPVSNILDVPRWLLNDGEHFALQVAGDSMAGEGILDGDTVIVRREHTPRTGDVVVALVRGEATVKRYYPGAEGVIELRPSNPNYLPIRIRPESDTDLIIQGIVTGLIRKF